MIRVLGFWLVEFLLITGIGLLLHRLIIRRGSSFGIFDTFWLGLMSLVGLLQIIHFALPINGVILIAMAALGVAGWFFAGDWRRTILGRMRAAREAAGQHRVWLAALFLLVISLFAAAHSAWLYQPVSGDTSLYHWNIVRWYNEHPVVPGLANLYDRLGFNSSYLLWASLVDNLWADRRSAALMPGFLVVVMAAQWLCTLLIETGRSQHMTRLFSLLSFPYVLWLVWTLSPALYYDNAQSMVQLVLLHSILSWAGACVAGGPAEPSLRARCGFWMGLAALAFTFKLSGVLLPPLCLALAAWLLARETPGGWRTRGWWLALVGAGTLPGLLILGYLGRSAILSGWLLYPSPSFNLHLPWSVPDETVRMLYETYIRDWARMPGPEGLETVRKGFWYWFPKWHQIFRRSTAHECLWLGIFALAIWACHRRRPTSAQSDARGLPLFLIGMIAANIVLWFVGAPDLRFGEGLFWCWMALTCACAISAWLRSSRLAWTAAALIAAHLFLHGQCDLVPTAPFSLMKVDRAASRPVTLTTVPNGQSPPLQIYVADDASDRSPGDSPIPAAWQINPNLMWREPGNLRAGFWVRKADGGNTNP